MTSFPPDRQPRDRQPRDRRPPDRQPPAQGSGIVRPERTADDVLRGRLQRRRDRIRAEIHRNRTEPHKVPTWLLAAVLGAFLLGWLYLVLTS